MASGSIGDATRDSTTTKATRAAAPKTDGGQDHEGQRHVEEEDPSPRGGVDEVAAQERPHGHGDAAEARPRPDRRRPLGGSERALDDGEAARDEERGAGA